MNQCRPEKGCDIFDEYICAYGTIQVETLERSRICISVQTRELDVAKMIYVASMIEYLSQGTFNPKFDIHTHMKEIEEVGIEI